MTDLERWIDGDAPEDVAALLRVARAESPGPAALERALLGAAAGATALGTAAAAAAAEGSAAAGVAGAAIGSGATGTAAAGATGGALTLAALGKPLLGGLLAGTVFCTAVAVVRPPPSPAAAPPAAISSLSAPAAVSSSPPIGAPAGFGLESPAMEATPAPPASPVAPAASSPEDAALQAEVALVDRVRRGLDAGDPEAALILLDRHAREHGASGRLAPEARALRLEALTRLGRNSEARAVAREMLARDRGTPHQAKAEAALADRSRSGSAIDSEPGSGALPPVPAPNP